MNILYTVNNKYVAIMLTSLYSLIKNGNLPYINLYVVTSNFETDDYLRLEKFISSFDNITLQIYNLYDININKYNIPNWRGSQISNARLFYPRVIKEDNVDATNLLYLDSDTLIVRDLNNLNNHNDKIISACIDESSSKSYYRDKLGLKSYYNSGVLYFNLDEYLKLNIEDQIKNYSIDNLVYPDQDLLNIILSDKINRLEPRYNMSAYSFTLNKLGMKLFYNKNKRQISSEEIIKEQEYKTILHSYGIFNIKPWTNNNINPFNDLFMSYMNYVNDNYTKEDLTNVKKLLAASPFVFRNLVLFNSYLPEHLDDLCREVTLKL